MGDYRSRVRSRNGGARNRQHVKPHCAGTRIAVGSVGGDVLVETAAGGAAFKLADDAEREIGVIVDLGVIGEIVGLALEIILARRDLLRRNRGIVIVEVDAIARVLKPEILASCRT